MRSSTVCPAQCHVAVLPSLTLIAVNLPEVSRPPSTITLNNIYKKVAFCIS